MGFELIYLGIGVVSGIIAGLLGIGGGIIIVPALYYTFLTKGSEHPMQRAIASSLVIIFVTTLFATWLHNKRGKNVNYKILKLLIPGLVIGCIAGAELAYLLPSPILRSIFGAITIGIGVYFLIPKLPVLTISEKPGPLLVLFGFLIGALSSLLGIGGGVFTIPTLLAYKIPATHAIAISSAATMTTAFIGTIAYSFVAKQMHLENLIELNAFFWITAASMCATPIGVKLALRLPSHKIKQIFGLVMALTGISLVLV